MSEIIQHPGYIRTGLFTLEIFKGTREEEEAIFVSFDSFSLPQRSTRSFQIAYGPGFPLIEVPGPIAPWTLEVSLTLFFERNIWQRMILWWENTIIDYLGNLRDGAILGFDIDGNLQYKANLFRMYPLAINMGQAARSPQRQTMQVTLFVWDLIHDEDFALFNFSEDAPV